MKTREELKEIKRIKTLKHITFVAINSALVLTTVGLLSLAPVNLNKNNEVNSDFVKANQLIKYSNEYLIKCEYKSEELEKIVVKSNSVALQAPNKAVVESNVKKGISVRQVSKVVSRGEFRDYTKEEFDILCRIVEAETSGMGSVNQKENIAQVVLNRVKDERFPNTIKTVVFDKVGRGGLYEFCPLNDQRYYEVNITEDTRQAVKNVLELNSPKHNGLFFQSYGCDNSWFRTLDLVFKDGIHKFYR